MRKSLFIILGAWIILVVGFTISQEIVLRNGTEVLLKTVPVDPRDLLRGDYVILNYEVAQLPYATNYRDEETVYVVLKTDKNNIARRSNITRHKPSQGLYLKGRVGGCDTVVPLFRSGKCIRYGIESYFVKEGTGRELEKSLQNGALIKVVIDKKGSAKVKGFFKN